MNKKNSKQLISSLSGKMTRVGLTVLLTVAVIVGANAQTNDESDAPILKDLNSELRTGTWSIYLQSGISYATEVWYENIDAKRSYKQSPALGGGIDYTIRPWIRIGGEYMWSRYRREQRLAKLNTNTMPIKAYGNYMMNFHNAKLNLGFNFMEIWPERKAQWLNIWLGTGVGYTFAKGNEYGIYFNNTKTVDGTTTPYLDGENIVNKGSVSFTGNVQTKNRHEDFKNIYVPASLHIEADLNRRFTIGLKGEMDWLLNREDITPKNLIFALATVRYNFVPSGLRAQRDYYNGEISTLNDRLNALRREADNAKAQAENADKARKQAEQRNADLQRRLSDCEKNKTVVMEQSTHFVQFDHNSSYMSDVEKERLKEFAKVVKGKQLAIVAEASTPGSEDYNLQISERRLQRVIDFLIEEGLSADDLHPTTAIGEQNEKQGADGRRVTISID